MFFIPTILFLISVVGGISYYIYYSSILKEMEKNIVGTVEQGNYTVDLYFQDVKTTIIQLIDNDNLISMLTNYQDMTIQERYYKQLDIDEELMNTSLIRDHILDCIIVGENGYQTNMPDRQKLKYDGNLLEEEWLQPYVQNPDKKFYYTSSHLNHYYEKENNEKYVISVVFPVENFGKRLGYIIVDMDFQRMNQIISARSDINSLQFLIVDEEGAVVFSDEEGQINHSVPTTVYENLDKLDAFRFEYNGDRYFCGHEKSNTTGWELLGIVAEKSMAEPAQRLLKILCFIVLPCFVIIAVLLSIIISRRIKEPLGEIVKQMERVDIENPQPFYVSNSVGEIDHLALKITEMIERINYLVGQIYLTEMRSKDAQIEALISQINPHFLYNTLQLIKTEAALGESKEVADTVNCLSRFLRYTINNQEFHVSLRRELEYVRYYMEIYKKRFPDKFDLQILVAGETEQFVVPKLILQPLVENAIKHGLRGKEEQGLIRITSSLLEQSGDLLICVEDNGLGMEQKAADELLKKLSLIKEEGEHVGLKNVHERILLSSGEGYGIVKIESLTGMYFKLYLKIQKGGSEFV